MESTDDCPNEIEELPNGREVSIEEDSPNEALNEYIPDDNEERVPSVGGGGGVLKSDQLALEEKFQVEDISSTVSIAVQEEDDQNGQQVYAYLDTTNATIFIQNSPGLFFTDDEDNVIYVVREDDPQPEQAFSQNSVIHQGVFVETVPELKNGNGDVQCEETGERILMPNENSKSIDEVSVIDSDEVRPTVWTIRNNAPEQENNVAKNLCLPEDSDNAHSAVWAIRDRNSEHESDFVKNACLPEDSDNAHSAVWAIRDNVPGQDASTEMVFIPAQSIVSSSQIAKEESNHRKLLKLSHTKQESLSPNVSETGDNSRSMTEGSVIVNKPFSELESPTSPSVDVKNKEDMVCSPSVSEDTVVEYSQESDNTVTIVPQYSIHSNSRTIDNAVSVIHSPSTYSISGSTFASIKAREVRKPCDQAEDSYLDTCSNEQVFHLATETKLSTDEDSNTMSSQTSGLDLTKDSKISYSVPTHDAYFSGEELKITSDSQESSKNNLSDDDRCINELDDKVDESSDLSINRISSRSSSVIVAMDDESKERVESHNDESTENDDSLTMNEIRVESKISDIEKAPDEFFVNSDEKGFPKTPEGSPKTPEGCPKTPEGRPKTPEGRPKTPEGRPKTPEGRPKTPEGRPQTPEGCPQTPEGCPQTPEGCPQTPEGCPQTPEGCPQTPEGCPQTPEGCPKTPEGCPKTPEGCPKTPEGRPKTPEGCPKTPEGSPELSLEYPRTPEEYPDTPESSPRTPEGYPKTPEGYPKTPEGYPKTPEGYPKTPEDAIEDMEVDTVSEDIPELNVNTHTSNIYVKNIDINLVSKASLKDINPTDSQILTRECPLPKKRFKIQPDIEREIAEICDSGNSFQCDIVSKIDKEASIACHQQYKKDIYDITKDSSDKQDLVKKVEEHLSLSESKNNLSFHNALQTVNDKYNDDCIKLNEMNISSSSSIPEESPTQQCVDSAFSKLPSISMDIQIPNNNESNKAQSSVEGHGNSKSNCVFNLMPDDVQKVPPKITYSARKRERSLTPENDVNASKITDLFPSVNEVNDNDKEIIVNDDVNDTDNKEIMVNNDVNDNKEIIVNDDVPEKSKEKEISDRLDGNLFISSGKIKASANYTRKRKSLPPVVREIRTRSLRPRLSASGDSLENDFKDNRENDTKKKESGDAANNEEFNWGNILLATSFQSPSDPKGSTTENSPKKKTPSPTLKEKPTKYFSKTVSKSEVQWEKFVKSSSPKKTNKNSTKKLREKVKKQVKTLCNSEKFNSQFDLTSTPPKLSNGRKSLKKHKSPVSFMDSGKKNTSTNSKFRYSSKCDKSLSCSPVKKSGIKYLNDNKATVSNAILDDSCEFVCSHCEFYTNKVNNLVMHMKYCANRDENLGRLLDYSVNDMERRQRIRGEEGSENKERSRNHLSNGATERDINEPSCSNGSRGRVLDDSDDEVDKDELKLGREQFGFIEKSIVWVERETRYYPAVIWRFIRRNACVFLITSSNTYEKLKVSIDRLHSFDDAKWNNDTLKKANNYPEKDNFLKAVQKCQSYLNKVCIRGQKRLDIKQFFKIPEDEDFSDTEECNEDDVMVVEHVYLDLETSSEEDSGKEFSNLRPKEVSDYISQGKVDAHLLSIYNEEIPNENHKKFNKQTRDKRKAEYEFGPYHKDEHMDSVFNHLEELFRTKIGEESYKISYIHKVWVPEALVRALSAVKNISLDEAETLFYSIQVDSKAKAESEKRLREESYV